VEQISRDWMQPHIAVEIWIDNSVLAMTFTCFEVYPISSVHWWLMSASKVVDVPQSYLISH